MLTIYFTEGSAQVLEDFSDSFLSLSKSEKMKYIKDIVHDIAKGSKCTYTWQELV